MSLSVKMLQKKTPIQYSFNWLSIKDINWATLQPLLHTHGMNHSDGTEIDIDSEAFLDRLKQKDTSAITKVVRRFARQIYNTAVGLGYSDLDADELVQLTMVTFYDVLDRFKGQSSVRTFVFGIFFNKVKERQREDKKKGRHHSIDLLPENLFQSNGSWKPANAPVAPDEFVIISEDRDKIRQCIMELPLSQRMAFQLKVVEERDSKEICNILEISETN